MTRQLIEDIVARIDPVDDLEAGHIKDTLDWIRSGAPLFRLKSPADPPKHLVSYFVLYDQAVGKIMLIDHIKAQSWLPTGGHVELDEDPKYTVVREADEELAIAAEFSQDFGETPFFITVTNTKGSGSHIDVSLWYVIKGDATQALAYDPAEMNGYKWLSPREILATDIHALDPHMHRFVRKMQRFGVSSEDSL
jgi:8-oxo-dGTP pyrophosphatase MutT (NUDIX family)